MEDEIRKRIKSKIDELEKERNEASSDLAIYGADYDCKELDRLIFIIDGNKYVIQILKDLLKMKKRKRMGNE